jgi:hypothetical protein
MMATRRAPRFRHKTVAAAAAAALVLLGGCSSSNDAGASSADMAAEPAAAAVDKQADAADSADSGDSAVGIADVGSQPGEAGSDPGSTTEQQKVISTGNVQLRSDDVGQAIFDVRKVVDVHRGTISEDDTATDKDGSPLRSRMVLRIPTDEFDAAMTELEKVGTLLSSKRSSEDVTTQVLDIGVRVEAQKRSIQRIQVLFDNATSIKDVVSIEGELSQRQADLASLEAQQRYLADQTAMSTITLSVERTVAKAKPKPHHDDASGFISGFSDGWGALQTFLVGAATVAGVLLPWALLLLVLVAAGWPLLRRLRRHEEAAA